MRQHVSVHVEDGDGFEVREWSGYQWLCIGNGAVIFLANEQIAKLDECLRYWLLDKQLDQASIAIVDNVE